MLVARALLPPVPRRSGAVAAAAAGLLLLAGCGGDDKKPAGAEAQVREVVRRYGVAVSRKDYQQICDRLVAASVSEKAEQIGLPCELAFKKGLEDVRSPRLRIDGVRVDAPKKTAYVKIHTTAVGQPASDDTMQLKQSGTLWQITAVGGAIDPEAAKTPAAKTATGDGK